MSDDKTTIDPSAGAQQPGAKMKLGPYETTELLGRGGMAVVYKGIQQSLGRVVAIKILPKEFSRDRQFVGRFHREAESVAKLNHPNIIQIIDKGEAGGTCYFVMEYVKGTSLGSKLAAKGVTFKEVMEIGLQVCSALHFAHEQGVVHRDIKPANILLDETTGVAKVADFGIAQLAEKSTAIGTLTGDHMAMGTLDYMAPEQKRDAKNVDRRADIYSVGVMLYEMTTGRVPMGIFDPPSRINKDIPKDFDAIVMKCLRDKPDERYQSCLELTNALTTLPQSPSTMIRMITSVKSGVSNIGTQIGRRNPRYIVAVLFLVAGLGVGSFAIWKWGRVRLNGGGGQTPANRNSAAGNGGDTARPPDNTVNPVAEAEKRFLKRMQDAFNLADKRDYKGAIEIYNELLRDATGSQRAEITLELKDVRQRQEDALADGFLGRLQETSVDPAMANAESVTALQKLLDEARDQKVRQDVMTQIAAELERTRNDAKKNVELALEAERAAMFRSAAEKAKAEIEADKLEEAEASLQIVGARARGAAEAEEYGRLKKALEGKRGVAATAEENRKRFDKSMEEAERATKLGDFDQALLRLEDAGMLAPVVGGDAAERVSAARAELDKRQKNVIFEKQMTGARALEQSDALASAAAYRAAAAIAPSQADADNAIAKAKILEAKSKQDAATRDYEEHMEAARKAKALPDWRKVEAEARAALLSRGGDPEATKLLAEARKALEEKPPDPKKLAFTNKGVFKGRYGGLDSVALDPAGVFYALDKHGKKLITVAKDLTILRETVIPLPYPDRVYVDSKGRVWISEWGNLSTINLIDTTDGSVKQTMGGKGSADGKFLYLTDIAVSPDGEGMYGFDSKNFRIQRLAVKDGSFVWKCGVKFPGGKKLENFIYAAKNLTVDAQGRVFASDSGLRTIQRYKPDGTYDGIFKTFTEGLPGAMAWSNNRLYVMDTEKIRLLVYAPDGAELCNNVMYGKGESQLLAPTGITVGPDGKVYIADYHTKVVVLEEAK
ncbi:MAG: serine/threonine protein kinase [Planctomycetota bacterium]|nr:MAG: serine/threonine protein kinase [Planctomycetota bacterium]